MTLRERFAQASKAAEQFARGELRAIDFEAFLVAMGFYNIEFHPPKAAFDGVVYPLMEMKNASTLQ